MNKKIILTIFAISILSLSLIGCKKKSYCEEYGHDFSKATCTKDSICIECGEIGEKAHGHDFSEATCTEDSVCVECGELNEEAHGHNFSDATCVSPATCTTCGITKGDALGHNFSDATCVSPATCTTCGITKGDALGHNFSDATCNNPATCTTCGTTKGDKLEHVCKNPTCEQLPICDLCGMPFGEIVNHEYTDATCTTLATCKHCGSTTGELGEHSWVKATFDSPKRCRYCGLVELSATVYKDYLSIGESANIFVDGYYDLTEFIIEISNPDVISIDEYGTIKALDKGIVTYTLSLKNGKSNKLTYTMEVIGKMPNIFTTYTNLAIGDTTAIFFKNLNELDESSINDFNITFKNEGIFELQEDLSIKALSIGNDILTITSKFDERITASINLSVVDENAQLIIYGKASTTSLQAGDQFMMQPTLGYETTELEWLTTDPTIAVVSKDGLVSIVSEGYVTISTYDPKNPRDNTKKARYSFYIEGIMDVDYVSRLIHTALAENGTRETGDNIQKYGEWYPNNGQPWCAMFVSWCWNRSGLSTDILLKYQGCTAGMQWCTEKGIMHYVQSFNWTGDNAHLMEYVVVEDYKPVAGDIIFFLSGGMSHTGIAIYSDDTHLFTIEGNTSDMVAIKRWSLNDGRITGYAHPEYPTYNGVPEDFSWIKEKQSDGTYLWTNVSEQQKVD